MKNYLSSSQRIAGSVGWHDFASSIEALRLRLNDEVEGLPTTLVSTFREAAPSTVEARFGTLAEGGWVPCLAHGLKYRRDLGLSDADFNLILALLHHHRERDQWPSVSQEILARDLGIRRSTVNGQIRHLRESGLVAVRPDIRFRPKPGLNATYYYSLEPYIAGLAKRVVQEIGEGQPERANRLDAEADMRFEGFLANVAGEAWQWRVGSDDTTAGATPEQVAKSFGVRHRVSFMVTRR